MKKINLFIVLAIAGTLCTSCSQEDSIPAATSCNAGNELFKFNLLSRSGDKISDESLSSLHAYAFSDGAYLQKFENIDISSSNFQLSMSADKQKKLFFLGNHTPLVVDENTFSETELLNTVSSTADATGVVYKKKFDTPLMGATDVTKSTAVFFAYENGSKEADITIYGKYSGVNVEVIAKATSMKRNNIYTIRLNGVGQSITGSIDIKPWENGSDTRQTLIKQPQL